MVPPFELKPLVDSVATNQQQYLIAFLVTIISNGKFFGYSKYENSHFVIMKNYNVSWSPSNVLLYTYCTYHDHM